MGWQQAFYVALLYLGVQTFEGNVTAPLIQQRATDLPPALTLVAQTAFGLIFGLFGVILATRSPQPSSPRCSSSRTRTRTTSGPAWSAE
jgi:hypothetical protein